MTRIAIIMPTTARGSPLGNILKHQSFS